MTSASEKLYQSVILDHSRKPRNFGVLESNTHTGRGFNRLCGDEVTVFLRLENSEIVDLRFDARGCALCIASSSLMSEVLKGNQVHQARELSDFMTKDSIDRHFPESLMPLREIWKYPARIRCVTLPWQTFLSALSGKKELEVGE